MAGKEERSAVRAFGQMLALAYTSSPPFAIACLFFIVAAGVFPVAFTVVTGRVVGAIPVAVEHGLRSAAGHKMLFSLGLLGVVTVLIATTSYLVSTLSESLESRFTLRIRDGVLEATLSPVGIAHLDDPATSDALHILESSDQRWYAENAMSMLSSTATAKVTGIGSAVVLATYRWWAPFVMIASTWFYYRWMSREVDTFFASFSELTPGLRRAAYFRDLAVRPEAAKELRIFGLSGWIVDRFKSTWTESMRVQWAARRGHAGTLLQAVVAEILSSGVVYFAVAYAAIHHQIGIGGLAVYVGAVQGTRLLGPNGDNELGVIRSARTIAKLAGLSERLGAGRGSHGRATPERVGALRFEAVSFSYPGTAQPVLEDLTLEIPAGRSLAIVGLNGAGKTTLVKLLARLYDPTGGRITSDGVDIQTFDPDAWRRRFGVIFQDFVRFELSAKLNVGFGSLDEMSNDAAFERVAASVGAKEIIERLPKGWDTILSRGYDGGVDLSGGEWQRIALARALMAVEGGADLLVLDEPTANLDIRAESELFDRFLETTRGATTILISHRFGTVRHVDRIVVIENGRVVEQGSHDELLARSGRYARLFRLQSERFTDGSQSEEVVEDA